MINNIYFELALPSNMTIEIVQSLYMYMRTNIVTSSGLENRNLSLRTPLKNNFIKFNLDIIKYIETDTIWLKDSVDKAKDFFDMSISSW